ncbi:MAG: lipoprotein-releasing system ATP-binding protein LolD [Flavobacteriales bacterium TMED123]|nr:MAG: lipoprotein-releasing system ATP-binding protein LolD [Flavobacteriales bacterium TMED123]
MIKAKNIHFSYGNLQVLKGLDLEIEKGEFVSIVGASGSGKTTLLQLLGTLEKSDSGDIVVEGKSVQQLSEKELAIFRNQKIGFVFQFHNLLAEFSSLENVCLPAFIAGKNKKSAEKYATELLKMLRLENRLHHKPNELSGGEQQRVAVARALINRPAVILADEPSGNLDSKNAAELHELLVKLNKEKGQTIVAVTHNAALANIANRKVEIIDGKLNS